MSLPPRQTSVGASGITIEWCFLLKLSTFNLFFFLLSVIDENAEITLLIVIVFLLTVLKMSLALAFSSLKVSYRLDFLLLEAAVFRLLTVCRLCD